MLSIPVIKAGLAARLHCGPDELIVVVDACHLEGPKDTLYCSRMNRWCQMSVAYFESAELNSALNEIAGILSHV